MTYEENAFVFECNEESLIGIAAIPEKPVDTGVLIIVGGPQYRIGSHRQFLLLSRDLAEAGIPCMRFDYRGMGDSEGAQRNFEAVEEDIRAALDAFFDQCPGMKKVVLWGLCDAASASIFYAHKDPRIKGLIILNPWARTVESEAKARLKHYYLSRIFDPSLWKKLLSGKFEFGKSLKDLSGSVSSLGKNGDSGENLPLPEKLRKSLERFSGKILLILSGDDLTAREFEDLANSQGWKHIMKKVERLDLPDADHTFSRRQWRDHVSNWTIGRISNWKET